MIELTEVDESTLFAKEFAKKLGAYLTDEKGAIVRINKALNGKKGLSELTRLFNEMTNISSEVRADEFRRITHAEDIEQYATDVAKAAGAVIFNQDFTALKPEFEALFPRIDEIKALCLQEGTTVVDMLLKGVSALHAQCFADEVTQKVKVVTAHTGTNEDQRAIITMAAIGRTLEKVQRDISKASLESGEQKKIKIDPAELERALNTMLGGISNLRQRFQQYAKDRYELTPEQLRELRGSGPRQQYLQTLDEDSRAHCEEFLTEYDASEKQSDLIEGAYDSVFDEDIGFKTDEIMSRAQEKLNTAEEKMVQSDNFLTVLELTQILKKVEAELEPAIQGLFDYNDALLKRGKTLPYHEQANQEHSPIKQMINQRNQLVSIIPMIKAGDLQEHLQQSRDIILTIQATITGLEPSKPQGMFASLKKAIIKVLETVEALFSREAKEMMNFKQERKVVVAKMQCMKEELLKIIGEAEERPEMAVKIKPSSGMGGPRGMGG